MPSPGVVGVSHGLWSHFTDEETESWSVYVICPGLVSDICVFELMNFHYCFLHFENWRGKKTNRVLYSFLGGVEK